MKLTKKILWDDNFINKFTNLRTSFLIFLTRILVDSKEKHRFLYDDSYLNDTINVNCCELFKKTNTILFNNAAKNINYYPQIVYISKFGKPIINHKFNKKITYFKKEKIKFEDGIKYILKKLFEDSNYVSQIELFRIKISNFITKENEKYKNELIEEMFKYLSDTFSFPSSIKYTVDGRSYYIESIYKITTDLNNLTSNLNLYFTISFKLCSDEAGTPISFTSDSISNFDLFYKELKENSKKFLHKQKIISKLEREANKYL